jgi:hypothetical protein
MLTGPQGRRGKERDDIDGEESKARKRGRKGREAKYTCICIYIYKYI